MDDLIAKYNTLEKKWKRIDEIINMSQPKLIKKCKTHYFYRGYVMYMSQKFYYGFSTISKKLNIPHIRDEIVYQILEWELKERGIEYPPRLKRS